MKTKTWFLVGLIISAALSIVLLVLGSKALASYQDYRYEIDTTPTPLVRRASVDVVQAPTADPNATPEPTPMLFKNGSSGEDVVKIQQRLKELGYLNGAADGQFGNATKDAVVWFQQQHNLDADGLVGKLTYDLLFSDSAAHAIATPSPSPTSTPSAAGEDFLVLVNKTVTLPDDYTPSNLVKMKDVLSNDFIKIKYKNTTANLTAIQALEEMLLAAHEDGIQEWQISSAYRSIVDQKKLLSSKKNDFMMQGFSESKATSAALQTVAKPGTSEHHTGLAFDITVPGQFFKGTKQANWIAKNCWDYGFIVRYQEGKEKLTGYLAEPWHIRYVGLPHSKIIRDKDLTLEQYLTELGMLKSN